MNILAIKKDDFKKEKIKAEIVGKDTGGWFSIIRLENGTLVSGRDYYYIIKGEENDN
jgi:hypothetical protein